MSMTLLAQITEDWKQAMRDKAEPKKTVLNFVLAQAKYKKIELQKDPEDADMVQILKKEIKAFNEAIGFMEKANKPEDIEVELQKKAILEAYLPQTMSKEQSKELIQKLVAELGITDLKTQRGMLMKELMAKHKSEIDGALVNEVINEML